MMAFIKKWQNLILGLLIALFIGLLLGQSISLTGAHDVNIKDFSIMRTVSVSHNSDVKASLRIFEEEIGDSYSFDAMYNAAYALLLFGVLSMVLCFKGYNKSFASKVVVLAYSLYSLYILTLSANLGYIYRTYDKNYIFKIVVAVLILAFAVGGIIEMLKKLAANGWFEKVNIHAFLNALSMLLMFLGTALMFVPFVFDKAKTASILGFVLLPGNYKSTLVPYLTSHIDNYQINYTVLLPVAMLLLAIIGSLMLLRSHKNAGPTIFALVWAVLGVVGFLFNQLLALDPKFIVYMIIFVAVIALSVVNLVQYNKVKKILEQG